MVSFETARSFRLHVLWTLVRAFHQGCFLADLTIKSGSNVHLDVKMVLLGTFLEKKKLVEIPLACHCVRTEPEVHFQIVGTCTTHNVLRHFNRCTPESPKLFTDI